MSPMPSREDFFKKAKKKVHIAVSSRDNLLIQTVSAVDELNKSSNLLFERLTEWYGMYFPEFKTPDNAKYVQGVLAIDRANLDMAELERVFGPQAQSVAEKAKSSMGKDFSPEDLAQARSLASSIQALWSLRNSVESYEAKIANELCPNLSHIIGPELAAKLVAQSGGLQRMASFPSSTIQVLGAEKALFKHLKSGSRPPKHGLIFQHSLVGMSPKKARGKIARCLAAKLAIAVKADAITHHFIADKLKASFEAQAQRALAKVASDSAKMAKMGVNPNRQQAISRPPVQPSPQGNQNRPAFNAPQGNNPNRPQGSQQGGSPNRPQGNAPQGGNPNRPQGGSAQGGNQNRPQGGNQQNRPQGGFQGNRPFRRR